MKFLDSALQEQLGEGAFGEVWRAIGPDGEVAIKLLHARKGAVVDVLVGEAERLARLNHPRIVEFVATGTLPHRVGAFDEGTRFIVTELIRGPSLDNVVPPNWRWVQSLTLQILDGLAAAHANNIVHLDIKPANILLRSHRPDAVIADFGVSYQIPWEVRDADHPFSGTPLYMAPEQITGRQLDFGPWTDLYAVGCMVYELCSGTTPFTGRSLDVLRQHLEQTPPPLGSTRFGVPPRLQQWLDACLTQTNRFERSADAAWAFAQVCIGFDESNEQTAPDAIVVPDARTVTWTRSDFPTLAELPTQTRSARERHGSGRTFGRPLMPADWARGQDLEHGPLAPLTQERAAFDGVWAQMRAAANEHRTRMVQVIGEIQSSHRLLRQLLRRAHEVGVGSHILVPAESADNPADMIVGRLLSVAFFDDPAPARQRWFELHDLSEQPLRDEEVARIADWTGELQRGDVVRSADERQELTVAILGCLPRTPHVVLHTASPLNLALADAISSTEFAQGAMVFLLAEQPATQADLTVYLQPQRGRT